MSVIGLDRASILKLSGSEERDLLPLDSLAPGIVEKGLLAAT